jgi:hypothetical protein
MEERLCLIEQYDRHYAPGFLAKFELDQPFALA